MRNKIVVIIITFILLYSFLFTLENGELSQHGNSGINENLQSFIIKQKHSNNFLTDSYYIFFNESGLPSGSNWSVSLKSSQGSISEYTASSQIIFYVLGGNYSVTIYVPDGYTINSQSGKSYSIINQQNSAGGGKNISVGYINVNGNAYIPVSVITDNNGSDIIIVTSIIVSLLAILFVLYYYTRYNAKNKIQTK